MKKCWVKWLCAALCVAAWTVGALAGVLAGIWYFEGERGFPYSEMVSGAAWEDYDTVRDAVWDWYDKGGVGQWDPPDQLSADKTNFRYVLYVQESGGSKQVLGGNVADERELSAAVPYVYTNTMTLRRDSEAYFDPVPAPTVTPDPSDVDTTSDPVTEREVDEGQLWAAAAALHVTVHYGVTDPLTQIDQYYRAQCRFEELVEAVPTLIGIAAGGVLAGLVLLILLMVYAGRRSGVEGIRLTWHERIPYDVYLVIQFFANVGIWVFLLSNERAIGQCLLLSDRCDTNERTLIVAVVAVCALVEVILALALLLTTVVRLKARTILRNTVIARLLRLGWRALKAAGRGINKAFRTLPMVWRAVLAFVGYLFVGVMIVVIAAWNAWDWGGLIFVAILWNVAVLYLICRWVYQWRKIRLAVGSIVAGKTDTQIDTKGFSPDLKEHALQLNDLGHAIDAAVEERMKSERFKAELITNVSHDLKTPLTSIINYVDLLKKEEIDNDTAKEYIEVLDRKSQRLKKLTEDLVEASKASTGVLAVARERLDLAQLIRQAMGEYEEKLAGANLTPVLTLPEGELYITADGRHLWRVLDNLLNNCVKYAMEGTRVYVDAAKRNDTAVITVKNISRQGLNLSAEQLMERFVRGDESRTTEGSGLGLSIARSLVELQGGQFQLDIDGDLFKTKIMFLLA